MSVVQLDATSSDGRRRLLGEHLAATRARAIGSASRAAAAAGIGRNSYSDLERGERVSRAETWAKVEDVLGWPKGSAAAYLDGRGDLPRSAMRAARVTGLPADVEAVMATRNAHTPAEQVAVLQSIILDVVRATSGEQE